MESEWCKKELAGGLIRELDEKRVVVLPLLLEDCAMPMFLRDKKYADFRTDFDSGLRDVLESIARVTSESLARVESPEWHVDWSIDWGFPDGGLFFMLLTAVEQAVGAPYSVLTQIQVDANETASARYLAMQQNGLDWAERAIIIDFLCQAVLRQNVRILLEDQKPKTRAMVVADSKSPAVLEVNIVSRRLGMDTGRDILIDIGGQLKGLLEGQYGRSRKLKADEVVRLKEIRREFETEGLAK